MLAAILNMFAVNPAYLAMLDPSKNPTGGNAEMHHLQQLRTLVLRVKNGEQLEATSVKSALAILKRAGMIDDLTLQHSAAEVFERMLRCLDRSGSQSIAIREATEGSVKVSNAPIKTQTRHTRHALHVAVGPGTDTVEEAIAATFGTPSRQESHEAVTDRTSFVASLPSTLTIVLHRTNHDQALLVRMTLEMPYQALASRLAGATKYRLTGFVTTTDRAHAHMLTYQRV
jgi:hypothetical protein